MKKYIIYTFTILATALLSCSDKDLKKAEFKVRGNCEMCKERIEKAALNVDGVKEAIYNIDNKTLAIKYNDKLESELAVHMAVAKVGHGTEKIDMDEKAHEELPECCQVRKNEKEKEIEKEESEMVAMTCCKKSSCVKQKCDPEKKNDCAAKTCCSKPKE
jgi:Cu(I)/Ag(I) efflux system membrane fusion protein